MVMNQQDTKASLKAPGNFLNFKFSKRLAKSTIQGCDSICDTLHQFPFSSSSLDFLETSTVKFLLNHLVQVPDSAHHSQKILKRYKTIDTQKLQNLTLSKGYDIVQNIFENNTPNADDAENKGAKNKKKQYNNELLQKLYGANYQLQKAPESMQRAPEAFNELIEEFKPKEETPKTLKLDPNNTGLLKLAQNANKVWSLYLTPLNANNAYKTE